MESIDKNNLPGHIAVIMDGNGRWAKRRLLQRIKGHKRGVDVARDTVTNCRELGIKHLTLYTFSKENWNRPESEVNMLMKFLESHLKEEKRSMMENDIRFRAIGTVEDLPVSVQHVIDDLETSTAGNSGMTLNLALSYSSREEILGAVIDIAERVKAGTLDVEEITEEIFRASLHTDGIPDPDLLIRTSGERRISNFLLWQLAYTEIYVTDVLWPDFTKKDLLDAIKDYQTRERRFGLTGDQALKVALS